MCFDDFLCTSAEQPLAWPQFRGPGASGIAENEKPPVEFGPEKNVKWKVPVPAGLSSPIVVGDKLVITAFENGKLYTIAYNRADGSEAWRAEAPAKQIEKFLGRRGQPGRFHLRNRRRAHRFVLRFVRTVLLRPDRQGVVEDTKCRRPKPWPVSARGVSPMIADGLVILARDEVKDSKIIAIDVATGNQKWEKKRDSI